MTIFLPGKSNRHRYSTRIPPLSRYSHLLEYGPMDGLAVGGGGACSGGGNPGVIALILFDVFLFDRSFFGANGSPPYSLARMPTAPRKSV